MSTKKRGLILLLVLVLTIQIVSATRYQDLIGKGEDDEGRDNILITATFGNDLGLYTLVGCTSGGYEIEGAPWPVSLPSLDGCYFFGVEEDDCGKDNDDSYGYYLMSIGTQTSYGPTSYLSKRVRDTYVSIYDGHEFQNILESDNVVVTGGQGLCADDRYWHVCTLADTEKEGKEGGIVYWSGGALYKCVIGKENYPGMGVWELLFEGNLDEDHDGYTADIDSKDKTTDDPAGCPSVNLYETTWTGLTLEEVRSEVRSMCEEDTVKYAGCAICINPGAPEICGDTIDNDGDSETSDDCNKNQYSCTQADIPSQEEALHYCSNDKEKDCAKDSDCQTEEKPDATCIIESAGKSALNIYNTAFSWIKTEEGGWCCGYHGIADLGKISSESGNAFVCLNKEKISSEADWENIIPSVQGKDEPERCSDNWCWIPAVGNAKFKVITVKKPGVEPVDVVSNNLHWFECNSTAEQQITDDFAEDKRIANRFYCFHEGNRWSWAECAAGESSVIPQEGSSEEGQEQPKCGANAASRSNCGIKGRFPGEGLFTLPLSKNEGIELRAAQYGDEIIIKSSWFDTYYEQPYFDFSDYEYLNFMLTFVDENNAPVPLELDKLPVDVSLTILSPLINPNDKEGKVLFEGRVLGYVINNPLFAGNWMHVKVPLSGNLKAVDKIMIKVSPEGYQIGVKNVYLSSNLDIPNNNYLCSGKDTTDYNSWLTDMDEGSEQKDVKGEDLCTALYGPNAWLGDDTEIDFDEKMKANCCGDDEHEYYAGPSREEVLPGGEGENSKKLKYGCWNSEVIASGKDIMNVEFGVISQQKEYDLEYESLPISGLYGIFYNISTNLTDPAKSMNSFKCAKEMTVFNSGEPTFKIICTFSLAELPEAKPGTFVWFDNPYGPSNEDYVEVFFYDLTTMDLKPGNTKIAHEDKYLKEGSLYLPKKEAEKRWHHDLAVVAQLKPNQYFPVANYEQKSSVEKTVNKIYSCSSEPCIYPLPGEPPYTITNPHPDLYELYFVWRDEGEKKQETLITPNHPPFETPGNIIARKVAKQVLFYNTGEDELIEPGFYGCAAASFLAGNVPEEYYHTKPYCSVIGTKFCSPFQTVTPEDELKDKYFLINSWSPESIRLGYVKINEPEDENISEFYKNTPLMLTNTETLATERTNLSMVFPTRNFIPNAEFLTRGAGKNIPFWQIISNGLVIEDEKDYFSKKEGLMKINSGEVLRSERIAVTQSIQLKFSQDLSCKPKIILRDKEGNPTGDAGTINSIKTGKASYLILEFTGPCQVKAPVLQLLDELGPAATAYNSQHEVLKDYDVRAGLACCPESFCWNGYACVEPMAELTSLTEYVSDSRSYRCINGQWKKTDIKWDWNGEKWGFCQTNDQCFVLSSGNSNQQPEDFYTGNYPNCVGNSKFIFDHYCEKGNWTSRTKFLATQLMEVAEDDDYVLYCSSYSQVLPDYQDQDSPFLGGTFQVQEKEEVELGEKLAPVQPKMISTCFNGINEVTGAEKLVKLKDNTCINNVCVLKYKDGGKFKVAFATTLNHPLEHPDSLLLPLNIPQNKAGMVCKEGKDKFVECDLSQVNLPKGASLIYSKELNAIIYARDGLKLEPSIIKKIMDWFSGLFGGEGKITEEQTFITEAKNFRDLYLLKNGEKKVRAVKEVLPRKQTLVAEYENFETPVCEYINHIKIPPDLEQELLEEVDLKELIDCTANGSKQVVRMVGGMDYFWPQLTGRLRAS